MIKKAIELSKATAKREEALRLKEAKEKSVK